MKKNNSLHGFFLDADLDYPENLHEDHSDFPMVPEKVKIITILSRNKRTK